MRKRREGERERGRDKEKEGGIKRKRERERERGRDIFLRNEGCLTPFSYLVCKIDPDGISY